MKQKKHEKVTFKNYQMNQLHLPTDLEVHILPNHLVRVVNDAVERMNIEPLLQRYKGGGTSSFHPKMMLKVLIYAYTEKIYSSRQIAKALRENIYFMWISGNNTPNFRTINRFRSSTMKGIIDEIFRSVLELLIEEGYVQLENYFLDGTKIEANANRYSYVWKKNVERNKTQLQTKINELLVEIERINDAENEKYGDQDLEEIGNETGIDPEKLEAKIKELDQRLAGTKNTKLSSRIKKLKKEHLPRLQRYHIQGQLLGKRNSFSKTDPDATFMRTKEDHLKNSQLKPCYNVQIGTENQFVLGYSIHQKAADTPCFIPHFKKGEAQGIIPKNIITDAGYGSEENYEHLNEHCIGNYAKYSTFHQEQQKKHSKFIYDDFKFNPEQDEFTCPNGKKLTFLRAYEDENKTGYKVNYRIYESEDCTNCPLRDKCTRSDGNRKLHVNFRWQELKDLARSNLCSEKGISLRSKRSIEPESVFGMIKYNRSFRRFMLRGIEKVNVEWGLICIAHNLIKMTAMTGK